MQESTQNVGLVEDPLWFKDAIIYELHVKTFFDSNTDGYGDFNGLTMKLDYLADLGITALWLLPFYPSPFRDDGYDISDYVEINSSVGTMSDFKSFLDAAHKRGIRIITELVINHTSDQHPWFQKARTAPAHSPERDFYVWSDTDKKYPETRIIFRDTETSNWAWDPIAKAYYWHRFFSHQPDLNFNNPEVVQAVLKIMRFWLDLGVDGLRLDAIPYLCVREGTSNENLPETHAVIKFLRAELDKNYQNRIFLAEANQWPEDVSHYFGNGDECHMAYHFPLMPRMFMALAMEDRYTVVEILEQTPDIPANCQWAVFLRNHDELTLEMVSDRERDYMYGAFASDRRARLNLGIRRRLSPLMENDRRRIELMNSMLFSMPGTPVTYYGDEIGMGDNLYLGDRNGVRTPMQWSPDRNAGFSTADPESLYLPPIMDPVYGYQSINVEAQLRNSNSLLNWMKRIIGIRKRFQAFGRGTLSFIKPDNRKILVYIRAYSKEKILCVVNLSRFAQAVRLNLSGFKGLVPVELFGRASFPTIDEQPYQLTLPGYGFFWFHLGEPEAHSIQHEEEATLEEKPVLVIPEGWKNLQESPDSDISSKTNPPTLRFTPRSRLEMNILPEFLSSRRWFSTTDKVLEGVILTDFGYLSDPPDRQYLLTQVRSAIADSPGHFLPLAIAWEGKIPDNLVQMRRWVIGKVRQQAKMGYLVDAVGDDSFCRYLLNGIANEKTIPVGKDKLIFMKTGSFPVACDTNVIEIHRPSLEQSNTSIMFSDLLFLKVFRKLQSVASPEFEIGKFLTEVSPFPNIAALCGAIELEKEDGTRSTLAILQRQIDNQGDGWTFSLNYLERFLDELQSKEEKDSTVAPQEIHSTYFSLASKLGERVGQLHKALSPITANASFAPKPITPNDLREWKSRVLREGKRLLALLRSKKAQLVKPIQEKIKLLLSLRDRFISMMEDILPEEATAICIRTHGDLHLGQVLLARNDFFIIDFEGEPNRTSREARIKQPVGRDLAGMLRSFNYAACTALKKCTEERPQDYQRYCSLIRSWEAGAIEHFLAGYQSGIGESSSLIGNQKEFQQLLHFFLMEKVIYEIEYELGHRPDWLDIPVSGMLELLQREYQTG
ncbi:MAG: maltose alpha-D-glucosyltransferase [Candidatus Riflebacteria bacterium]|nr:maltose alpha-D-glucosyltransferase [Candidatus Riflebacteria bacterium]